VKRIGVVGIGKIARDQHLPVLRRSTDFELVACASRNAEVEGVANFATAEAMLDGCPALDAVAICTPPQAHFAAARLALARGKHVLLEKPPCATATELDRLAELGRAAERTLYQTWHSRHACGVAATRQWLSSRKLRRVRVTWKEDVRQWHPGQAWIWQAGGFGVFDPGINAISILTEILPQPFFVREADLHIPSNCESPIAADIVFATEDGIRIDAAFDFRQTGTQSWDIDVETDGGALKLSAGGDRLTIDGASAVSTSSDPHVEYAAIYRHFADLIADRKSDVDGRPFRLVGDAFFVGRRHITAPFVE
jgi:D-galactose 1-dehydrogenase